MEVLKMHVQSIWWPFHPHSTRSAAQEHAHSTDRCKPAIMWAYRQKHTSSRSSSSSRRVRTFSETADPGLGAFPTATTGVTWSSTDWLFLPLWAAQVSINTTSMYYCLIKFIRLTLAKCCLATPDQSNIYSVFSSDLASTFSWEKYLPL